MLKKPKISDANPYFSSRLLNHIKSPDSKGSLFKNSQKTSQIKTRKKRRYKSPPRKMCPPKKNLAESKEILRI